MKFIVRRTSGPYFDIAKIRSACPCESATWVEAEEHWTVEIADLEDLLAFVRLAK